MEAITSSNPINTRQGNMKDEVGRMKDEVGRMKDEKCKDEG
jgi:HAMP domain-containing protein